jgi:hypothetical protein
MPAVSIDTFFACTLLVSVAVIATAFMAGTMQTQISGMQDLNKQDYLRTIADHIASSYGSPADWGATEAVPSDFGLSAFNAQGLSELDGDKVTRLNSQNAFFLSYPQVFAAARLNNIAFGASVTQILDINVSLSGTAAEGEVTAYTFQVSVTDDSGSVSASLHCYVEASGFVDDGFGETSSQGVGAVTLRLPNSASGPALLVVFARAPFDDRITAYEVFPFGHLSVPPEPNLTFLDLSPLNSTLTVAPKVSGVNVTGAWAFSYTYQSNLTKNQDGTYAISRFTDKSPIVIVVQGTSDTAKFNEWTAYPQVPLNFGADFSRSETNVFVYPVTINGALYKLTLRFGDVVK